MAEAKCLLFSVEFSNCVKISAKLVLNNKGQTGVSVTFSQILSSWQPQKVIPWQIFQYSTLIGLLVPKALLC